MIQLTQNTDIFNWTLYRNGQPQGQVPVIPGGQQEGEHEVVRQFQGEHNQRKVLRVWVIVIGPVGKSESSWVHKWSPKNKYKSPNYKFLGLSLSTTSLVMSIIAVISPVKCSKSNFLIGKNLFARTFT